MARLVGWVIRWGDVSASHRETMARHALIPVRDMAVKIAWPIPGQRGHGVTPLIARVGRTAALVASDEGLWLSAEVSETVLAQDAAELVRTGVLGGWSMEFLELGPMARTREGLRFVRRGILLASTLVGEPAYPQSTVRLIG